MLDDYFLFIHNTGDNEGMGEGKIMKSAWGGPSKEITL